MTDVSVNKTSSKKTSSGNFEMIKLGLVLALYAAVSCAVLAVVNNFTSPKIALNQEIKINNSMKAFFPDEGLSFESTNDYEPKEVGSIKIENVILAKKDGAIVGGAAQVTGPTYDQGTILVGMKTDGTVTGLQFLKLSDSPGFGLKANDATFTVASGKTFYGQFEGKNAKDGFVNGKTFDGISGATITTDGVANLLTEGTNALFNYFNAHSENLENGGENEQ